MSNTDTTGQLLKMKQEIERKDGEVKTLKGRLDGLYEQLKDEFDCDTFEQGDDKHLEMKRKREKLEQELEKGISELEKDYNQSPAIVKAFL